MPGAQDPDELEQQIVETRERLAETTAQLVDKAHPKRVLQRNVEAAKGTVRLLVTGRQVVVQDDGTEVVREVRRERVAAVAGGVTGTVVLFVVWRRRRRRRSGWQLVVDAAQERARETRQRAKEAAEEARKAAEEARRTARRSSGGRRR